MSQTLSLYRLQQIDSQIDRLQARLQEIQKLLEDDSEIRALNEKLKAVDERCLLADQALKQAEMNVQNQFIKIEQTQSDLYGGKSHTPKELQDLQNDVFSLKRHLVTLEDRQIEAMQESETATEIQKSTQDEVNIALNHRAEICKGLNQEQESVKSELEKLTVRRNTIAEAIPTTELGFYGQLRQQRRGVAVAVIVDNSCGACGTAISLAQVQSAHSQEHMLLCPSCGRILYAN